jgi:hypothetical protein
MKRLLLSSIVVLAACSDGGSLGVVNGDLSITPTMIDLGDVGVGGAGTAELTIKNKGSGLIHLAKPESDSTETTLDGVPEALVPGQVVMASVSLSPTSLGPRTAKIHFSSDAKKSPSVDVVVTANGVQPAMILVPMSVDFGQVVIGDVGTATLTLANISDKPITIGMVGPMQGTTGEMSATLDPKAAGMLAPRSTVSVFAKYAPTDLGVDMGQIQVVDATGREPPASTAVKGEGVGTQITVDPTMISFDGVMVGDMSTRSFVVKNIGTLPHAVTALSIASSGTLQGGRRFSVSMGSIGALPLMLDPGEARQIDVVYAPTSAGMDSDAVLLASPAIERPNVLRVELAGTAMGPPSAHIDVTPPSIDFGAQPVNAESPQMVIIKSTGAADLMLSAPPAIDPSSAPYSIVDAPQTAMHPGESRMMYVVFKPTASGPAPSADLVISSNDPGQAMLRVPLSGSGQ